MKRSIIGALFSFLLLFPLFCHEVYAFEDSTITLTNGIAYFDPEVVSENGMAYCQADNNSETDITASVMVAFYREGRLCGVAEKIISIPANDSVKVELFVPFSLYNTQWTAKLFALDSNHYYPLSESAVCKNGDLKDAVISSNVILYEDAYYASLTQKSGSIDLNGHSLYVYGDFTQCYGSVKVNGGKLIVGGNYTVDYYAELYMNDPSDYVCVNGSFEYYSYGGTAAGKCTHTRVECGANDATCLINGNTAYWYCTTCKKYFSEQSGAHEITLESTVIPALGHHTVITDPAVAATTTSTGLTEGSHCSKCGEVLVAQNIVPKLNVESIAWTIDDNGTLIINGTGEMDDYTRGSAPWYSERTSVQNVEIDGSITKVGSFAFADFPSLTSLTLTNGIQKLGKGIIVGSSVADITIPVTVDTIDDEAFDGSSGVFVITAKGSYAETWCSNHNMNWQAVDLLDMSISTVTEYGITEEPIIWNVQKQNNMVDTKYCYSIYFNGKIINTVDSDNDTVQYIPTENGVYVATVYAVDGLGNAAYASSTQIDVYPNTIGKVSLSYTEDLKSDNYLTISADTSVHSQDLNYKFFVVQNIPDDWDKEWDYYWETDYTPDNNYQIYLKATSYSVMAIVRDAGGNTVVSDTITFTVDTRSLDVSWNEISDEISGDDDITAIASVSNGSGMVYYQFTLIKDMQVYRSSKMTPDPSFSLADLDVGAYVLVISAEDDSANYGSLQKFFTVRASEPLNVAGINISNDNIMLGNSVSMSADSNRNADDLTYLVGIYKNGEKIDSVMSSGHVEYKPDSVGVYSFAFEITDLQGQKAFCYQDDLVSVTDNWYIDTVQVSTTAHTGDTIVFAPIIVGSVSGEMKYDYIIYLDGVRYREVYDLTESSYSLNTVKSGNYYCTAIVQDQNGRRIQENSSSVSVSDMIYQSSIHAANYGTNLNLDELDGKDERDIIVPANQAITVSWSKASSSSYYRIEIMANDDDVCYIKSYNSNSYTIPASYVQPGTRIYVDVTDLGTTARLTKSMDFTVEGGNTIFLEDKPKIIVPSKNAVVNYEDLTIQWTKMNFATSFKVIIEYYCGYDEHELLRETVDGSKYRFTIPKEILQNGYEHQVRIIAYDASGNSQKLSTICFFVGCTEDYYAHIPEPMITSEFMSNGVYRDKIPTYPFYQNVPVTWSGIPTAFYYSLHLKNYEDKSTLVYDNLQVNFFNVPISDLKSGDRYEVEVWAHHTSKCYEKSDSMWFRAPYSGNLILDPPSQTKPELSKDATVPTDMTLQDFTVVWTPVSAAEYYNVSLIAVEDDNNVEYEAKNLTDCQVSIPKSVLFAGMLYSVDIEAYDASGHMTYESFYLRFASTNIASPVLLSPALSTSKENCSFLSRSNVSFSWGEVEGASKYRFIVKEYYDGDWDKEFDQSDILDSSITIPKNKLNDGNLYYCYILAYDQYGNSKKSEKYYFCVGSAGDLELSCDEKTFDYEGGSTGFGISTLGKWTAQVSDSWINIIESTGEGSDYVTITVSKNAGSFQRFGSVTFKNAAGGCAVLTVTQAANGSTNTGALRITNPNQGDTLAYEKFRVSWKYNYDHAYFKVELTNETTGKTVYSQNMTIQNYQDIPKTALAYNNIYRLTVSVYNGSNSKISSSSIVFRTETSGGGLSQEENGDATVVDEKIVTGEATIIFSGIVSDSVIDRQDITITWKQVLNAGYYWIALRDTTLYPSSDSAVKIIDTSTNMLQTTIQSGQLTAGHSYNLWIAAHTDSGSLINGKNIAFTVNGENEPVITETGVASGVIRLSSSTPSIGESVFFSGSVVSNGGILDMVRITIQDTETGAFCDYAVFDAAAIAAFGSNTVFDLMNVAGFYSGSMIYQSGSGYARSGSTSLSLTDSGKTFYVVLYAKNQGESTLHSLSSATFKTKESEYLRAYDLNGNDMNGQTLILDYMGNWDGVLYVDTNIAEFLPVVETINGFEDSSTLLKISDMASTSDGTRYTLFVDGKANPFGHTVSRKVEFVNANEPNTTLMSFTLHQMANPNIQSCEDGNHIQTNTRYLQHVYEPENETEHKITAVIWESTCARCGKTFNIIDENGDSIGGNLPVCEEHIFDADGMCESCGYQCTHDYQDTGEYASGTGTWVSCGNDTHIRLSVKKYFVCSICGNQITKRIVETDVQPEPHTFIAEKRRSDYEPVTIEKTYIMPDGKQKTIQFPCHRVKIETVEICKAKSGGCAYETVLSTESVEENHIYNEQGVCIYCGYCAGNITTAYELYGAANHELVQLANQIMYGDSQFLKTMSILGGDVGHRVWNEFLGYMWDIAKFDIFGLPEHILNDATKAYQQEAALSVIQGRMGQYSNEELTDGLAAILGYIDYYKNQLDTPWKITGFAVSEANILSDSEICKNISDVFDTVGRIGDCVFLLKDILQNAIDVSEEKKATAVLVLSDYTINKEYFARCKQQADASGNKEMAEIYDIVLQKIDSVYRDICTEMLASIDLGELGIDFGVILDATNLALDFADVNPVKSALKSLGGKAYTVKGGAAITRMNLLLLAHSMVKWAAGDILKGNDLYDSILALYENLSVICAMNDDCYETILSYISSPTDETRKTLVSKLASLGDYKQKALDNCKKYADSRLTQSLDLNSTDILKEKESISEKLVKLEAYR